MTCHFLKLYLYTVDFGTSTIRCLQNQYFKDKYILILYLSRDKWDIFAFPQPCIGRFIILVMKYRNDPKFSDRQVWANSIVPDQTASEQSDQDLHYLLFCLHLLDALLYSVYGKTTLFKF